MKYMFLALLLINFNIFAGDLCCNSDSIYLSTGYHYQKDISLQLYYTHGFEVKKGQPLFLALTPSFLRVNDNNYYGGEFGVDLIGFVYFSLQFGIYYQEKFKWSVSALWYLPLCGDDSKPISKKISPFYRIRYLENSVLNEFGLMFGFGFD